MLTSESCLDVEYVSGIFETIETFNVRLFLSVLFGYFMWSRCGSSQILLEMKDPIYAWRERMLDLYGGLARKAKSLEPVV